MSKLLSSVLDKVSENNNEYRKELRTLNNLIDEKTTALVGDIVTLSNYTADFSNTITTAKENLFNPISRLVESYVIKDLRSVENVNEQFVEKINDKLENASLSSIEEKNKFVNNLNTLLNEKYLEIVKIKRINFLNESGSNEDIEKVIEDFISNLKINGSYEESGLINLFVNYKNELYSLISKSLSHISSIYLNNFVGEVGSALNGAVDYEEPIAQSSEINNEEFKPFIPEINIPEVPKTPETLENVESNTTLEVPKISIPEVPNIIATPEILNVEEKQEVNEETRDENQFENHEELNTEMNFNPVMPEEIKEDKNISENTSKLYDVEEILKIAKSPVVTMPNTLDKKEEKPEETVIKEQDVSLKKLEIPDNEFNEKEIVEEMIRRLTNRLDRINERQSKYDEEKNQLKEDEAFVDNLVESSKNKKAELDKFEEELNKKEEELNLKKSELDKKINNVLPFANAVLKNE